MIYPFSRLWGKGPSIGPFRALDDWNAARSRPIRRRSCGRRLSSCMYLHGRRDLHRWLLQVVPSSSDI